jgi:hypothetical protein
MSTVEMVFETNFLGARWIKTKKPRGTSL